MHRHPVLALVLLLAGAGPACAAPLLPPALAELAGCWSGIGVLSDRPVIVRLVVAPVIPETLLAADLVTTAEANPLDRYQAHILVGGDAAAPNRIVSSWADSFGMAFAANGDGSLRNGGFDLTWFYPADNVVGRWRRFADQLALSLVRVPRDAAAGQPEEKPFADYALSRVACPTAAPAPVAPSSLPSPLPPNRRPRARTSG